MRILYIAHSFGSWGSMDEAWKYNLKETLITMGHEILDPGYDQDIVHMACSVDKTGKMRARNSEQFVTAVKKLLSCGGIDLIFTYFDNRHIFPEAIKEVRKLGLLTVNFFCNATHEFHKVSEVAPAFDYCIVPERIALEKYRAVGSHPIYLPLAANPKFYHPTGDREQFDVVFIGSKYLNREFYLAYLAKKGINVRAYGPNWRKIENRQYSKTPLLLLPRLIIGKALRNLQRNFLERGLLRLPQEQCFGPVNFEEMIALYSEGRVTLGLSDVLSPEGNIIRQVRLRDFEAPMSGACYITGYRDELPDLYLLGNEIDCYQNHKDLLEKIKFYLKNNSARRLLRENGRKRALAEHTWAHRFKKLFKEVGLENK